MTQSANIGAAVTEFINEKLSDSVNQNFTAQELRLFVMGKVGSKVSPGSSDRILRNLRQRKLVNYVLISRLKSQYRAVPVVVPTVTEVPVVTQ